MLVGNIVENCVGTIDTDANMNYYEKLYHNDYKDVFKNKSKRSSIIVS